MRQSVRALGAGLSAFALLTGAGLAQAQERNGKPERQALKKAEIERSGKDLGGDAFQREVRLPDGRVVGLGETTPAFNPVTGERLSGELTTSAEGTFRSEQGGLTIELAPSTIGAPTIMRFADGSEIAVSPTARLFADGEQQGDFNLRVRSVRGQIADTRTVLYPAVMGDADLLHIADPGKLRTELWLGEMPSAVDAARAGVVWFEEVIDLPEGWRIGELEVGTTFRTTDSLPIYDAQGKLRAKLEAPLVFEARTAKTSAGHFADAFAELRIQHEGVVTYRVGIPTEWLTDADRSYPVVIDPTISQGIPLITNVDPISLTINPLSGWWNAVAVSAGGGVDWDLDWGPTFSWNFSPDCDFVVANGNNGSITPDNGSAETFGAATGPAVIEHAPVAFISVGTDRSLAWDPFQITGVLEINVTNPGAENFTLEGPAGLGYALFAPGTDSAWRSRDDADHEGTLGPQLQTFDFNVAGIWAMVVFEDDGPGLSGSVDLTWSAPQAQPFNLEATSITLDAATYPDQQQASGTLQFTRDIVQTGTLPTGSTIDYAVYLSTDTTIDNTDHELWSFQGAGPGSLQLNGFIPANIPDGTYFIGMAIDAVAGETSDTDNQTFDAISDHKVEITTTPTGPVVIALQPGQATPTTGSPQPIEVTPNQNVFNVVAISGDDWNLTVEGITSAETGAAIDFVLANGNNGQIPAPSTGTAEQVSGSTPGSLFHTASSLIGASGQKTLAWGAGKFAHVFAHEVVTTGQYTLDIGGAAGFEAFLFAPGNASAYQARSAATYTANAGTQATIDLNQAGFWGLVLVKDGAPAPASSVTIDIQPVAVIPPTYNVEAQAFSVVVPAAHTGVLPKSVGDTLDLDIAIAVTGQLPAASSIDYTVYLSDDTTIDAGDTVLHQVTGAAVGQGQVNATIPQIGAGTYFVAIEIDAIQGESNAADNLRFEDNTQQIEVTPPVGIMVNAIATAVTTQSAPLQLTAGDTFDVEIDLTLTSLPLTTLLDYEVILSTDTTITVLDTVVLAAQATPGQHTVTCTTPNTLSSGDYFVALELAALANETNLQDNLVVSAAQDVNVTAIPPVVGVTLTTGPQTISQSDTFGFTPVQGVWNAVGVTALDPNDDWDIEVGSGFSFEFNPLTDFVLVDGNQGQIIDNQGDVSRFAGSSDAILQHVGAQSVPFGQAGQASWDAGDALLLLELDVPTAGVQNLTIDGPTGLRFATYAPGFSADFDGRDSFIEEGDLGPAVQAVDFNSAGVWAIAVFAEAGVRPATGTVNITWGGAPVQGFDLAAVTVDIAAGLSVNTGDTFDVTRVIANLGNQDAPVFGYAFYLSDDATIDPATDSKIFEATVAGGLAAGDVQSAVEQLTLPGSVADGVYFLGFEVVQLPTDAVAQNGITVALETLTVGSGQASSGTTAGTLRSGGGGGCSALGGEGQGAPWQVLLVLFAIGFVRLRRRS
ncbi:MAG: hypothetical protein ACYTFT_00110 [Planctomycetota bacterium]|jgi:hypothetical protein